MITCWRYRRIILRSVDANTTLPEPARNHVQRCPACRELYESEMQIARQLLAGAGAQKQSPSPFLHAKIMSSISRPELGAERSRARIRSGWSLGFGMACVLLGCVIWFHSQHSNHRAADARARPAPIAPVPQPSLAMKLPDELQLRQWTEKLDEPLETEMKLVVNDTKNAANSLANNFLPEKLRASLLEPAQN